jgi:hypothetical protein
VQNPPVCGAVAVVLHVALHLPKKCAVSW